MAQVNPQASVSETKQVGRFGLIGILNTLIDFSLYNLLFALVGLAVIPANVISTSVAITFSFIANKTFVFRAGGVNRLRQAASFVVITVFSVYVLQNSVLYLFTKIWPDTFVYWYRLLEPLIGGIFSQEFVVNNGAKAMAVGVGMVWNYLWYKKVVFKR